MVAIYDAAIIGAGADGLAAAVLLARAGHKTIVLERDAEPGGRCRTREFHPGFRASPFSDELAPIPATLFWELGLARRDALFAPAPVSLALWADRASVFDARSHDEPAWALLAEARTHTSALLARAAQDNASPPRWGLRRAALPWPRSDWSEAELAELARCRLSNASDAAHLVALALTGRSSDPLLSGSALNLLAPGHGGSGLVCGGLGKLAHALTAAAREAGAKISCGLEVSDIRHARGRTRGLVLADGSEIFAHAIVSTLDVKRTFLSLFTWNNLPRDLVARVNAFRLAGSTARLLVALESLPVAPRGVEAPALFSGPVLIAPSIEACVAAHAGWRSGTLVEALPITVRFPSTIDPSLAPLGSATMTVTIGAVPHGLFDGAWTREKRDLLRDRALTAIEGVLPGTAERVLGVVLLVPPDMEEALGIADGDLSGGEIAPDQMAGLRPGTGAVAPRTAVRGLYLAGRSTTAGALATCASGAAAAKAVIADFDAGILR